MTLLCEEKRELDFGKIEEKLWRAPNGDVWREIVICGIRWIFKENLN